MAFNGQRAQRQSWAALSLTGHDRQGVQWAWRVRFLGWLCCKSRQPKSVELEFEIIESGYARFW